jgi:hypothetical protein
MERDQIVDYVRVKTALGVTTLAQRREFHGLLNALVGSGEIQGQQDYSYVPQAPQDDWDIRWEHLVVIPGASSAR